MRECRWKQIKAVTSDSFLAWRTKQRLAPKTLNANFHSLRHTLATNLALAGATSRVAMEIMRQTAKTYTAAGLLPMSDAVAKLPSFQSPECKSLTNRLTKTEFNLRSGPSAVSRCVEKITLKPQGGGSRKMRVARVLRCPRGK